MSELTGDMAKKPVPILMNEIERLKAELAAVKGEQKPTAAEIVDGLFKTYKETTGTSFTFEKDPKDGTDFKYCTFSECPKFTDKHKSAMAKYCTPELWAKLGATKTSKGYTLSNAVQTGCLLPHLGVGCTAGDEESWSVFKDLYYPVIKDWHAYDAHTQAHPTDLDATKLKFSAAQKAKFEEYVASTRIRAARNISGYALPCGATDTERAGVEKVVSDALTSITDPDLKGTYYKLGEMTDEQRDFLLGKGYLFQIPTARNLLMGAGAARNWPANRGIFYNDNQTALAWCNEEDHCRIISMKDGGDIPDVFARFANLSKALEATGTKLMRNDILGYMGTCPSNLGTGLRASVMVKLVKFNELLENPSSSHEDKELLEQVCAQFDLQPRGSAGEHSPAVGAKFDVSNKQRLGYSEVQLVQKMIDGVTKLIALEEKLAGGATSGEVRAEAGIVAK
jgi:creatine kinase